MMTCKNCLYFNMCYVLAINPEEAEAEGAETDCSSFADRSRYVVREKGEWVDHLVRDWRCSNCGEKIKKVRNVDGYCYDDKPNFCPNCGADMRRREKDGTAQV